MCQITDELIKLAVVTEMALCAMDELELLETESVDNTPREIRLDIHPTLSVVLKTDNPRGTREELVDKR